MRKTVLLPASVGIAVLLACVVALLAALASAPTASAQTDPEHRAGWFQRCSLAKTGYFDPIVSFGQQEPVGHRHLFFGSTAISYNSSASDLLAGGTTCHFQDGTVVPVDGGNFSSYWVPDLLERNGNYAGGVQVKAYYKKGASSVDAQKVEPFPEGLKMLIRDRNNSKTNVKWYCSGLTTGSNGIHRERPYDCNPNPAGRPWVTTHIAFPQCGTGAPDSPEGKDYIGHMAYAGDNGCPKTHPHVFPRLIVTVKYATSYGAGSQLSGGATTDPATGFHADYMEAWKPGALKSFVDACIHGGINCRDGDRLP
jgi:Domain of unknown function (DUF1996)